MITLITGVPGAGKSLKAVELVQAALKDGRRVFSDIAGHNAPGIEPSPQDWRDTPEGSLVVYDEAQRSFPSTGRPGVAEDERIRALETHRHTGHDIVFITQSPALIHHHIRKLVGRHIHVHRAAGLKRATLFTWDFAVSAPNDRIEQQRADTENWQYPKDLFKYYKSATVHTHKFHIPKKIALVLVAAVVISGIVGFRFYDAGGLHVMHMADKESASVAASERDAAPPPPSPGPFASLTDGGKVLPLSGCAVTSVACRCWDGDGHQLDIDQGKCLTLAHGPLPIDFSDLRSRKKSASGPRSMPAKVEASPVGP